MIEIKSAYRDYQPPFDVESAVRRLFDHTNPKYLAGLSTLVLRNSRSLNHVGRRSKTLSRRRRVPISECRGLYHQKWNGESAWIEIFVDNVFDACPRPTLWIPLLRELLLGDVVFHEIGHHVHHTKVPEYREKEDVADTWKQRLVWRYIRRRYWYLLPILIPLNKVLNLVVSRGYLKLPGNDRH